MRSGPWEAALDAPGRGGQSYRQRHPEQAREILQGIISGVDVSFVGDRHEVHEGENRELAADVAEKVHAMILADVAAGKKAGPFDAPPLPHFCVSPIGAVPKRGSDKVRVIHNLSYPFKGNSINANVGERPVSLSSVGTAAKLVRALGPRAWLVKLDVEAAYKQVPVRPEDWHLLGFKWRGKYYYERVLPFGLKTSCALWELYATALHDLLENLTAVDGVTVVHYVDDFLFVAESREAAEAFLAEALALCEGLGLPMAAHKTEGPTQCLTFLGIEIDALNQQLRLDADRLRELAQLTASWREKKRASWRETMQLAGMLNFACCVVRPGRYFLRRIIDMGRIFDQRSRSRDHPMTLWAPVRADVEWWRCHLARWNGISLLYDEEWERAELIELFTDASTTGYGAYFNGAWFAGAWDPETLAVAMRGKRVSVPWLELTALVAAALTWGPLWRGRKITFRSDSLTSVFAIASHTSKDPGMMHLLRTLITCACEHQFDFRAWHIAGVDNVVADVLSRRGDCAQFRALCPSAKELPAQAKWPTLPPPRR